MNPEQQRIAIAEACGWTEFGMKVKFANTENPFVQRKYWVTGGTEPETGFHKELPDYLNDLNAMHDAEETCINIEGGIQKRYFLNLMQLVPFERLAVVATAAQRAEAFLKTIGKWEKDQP